MLVSNPNLVHYVSQTVANRARVNNIQTYLSCNILKRQTKKYYLNSYLLQIAANSINKLICQTNFI